VQPDGDKCVQTNEWCIMGKAQNYHVNSGMMQTQKNWHANPGMTQAILCLILLHVLKTREHVVAIKGRECTGKAQIKTH